jgi:protein required for attachment to host cells
MKSQTGWMNLQEAMILRLVLIAAPQTLGELRKILSKPVQMRIVTEVDKDLTKMSDKDLQVELEKIVWL